MNRYSELLSSPHWQRKRLEIMQLDDWKCRACHNGERMLNVHHMSYERGRLPWEYPDNQLVTLCEDCHAEVHEFLRGFECTLRGAKNGDSKAIRDSAAVHYLIARMIALLESEGGQWAMGRCLYDGMGGLAARILPHPDDDAAWDKLLSPPQKVRRRGRAMRRRRQERSKA
jgi:hypothetical protein